MEKRRLAIPSPLSRARHVWLLTLLLGAVPLLAQELKLQPTPFTVYLDFQALAASGARQPALPIWLESVEIDSPKTDAATDRKTTFRMRFRKFAGVNDELLLRLFFNDDAEAKPVVSAWTELGESVLESKQLGDGLGLPTSESLTVPMTTVDYIDVSVPGDGANIRGAFLSSLKKTETRQALDFAGGAELIDPFHRPSAARPGENDSFLFGRVTATLDNTPVKLSPAEGMSSTFEFELGAQPLLALVTFEILNVDANLPPEMILNNRPLGPAAPVFPDLADPGYQGTVRALERDMRFRYSGWLKCQKLVPGSSLQAGSNKLIIQLSRGADAIAVRAVEVQLKYNWENLDYKLSP
jgi:hypothetical protein